MDNLAVRGGEWQHRPRLVQVRSHHAPHQALVYGTLLGLSTMGCSVEVVLVGLTRGINSLALPGTLATPETSFDESNSCALNTHLPPSTMRSLALSSALFATSTVAVVYSDVIGFGNAPLLAPILLQTAAESPDNTSSVTFSESFDGANNQTWSWRINITNVAVPNATVPYPGESPAITPDPHVAYTTYDLSWPGSGTLNDQLADLVNSTEGGNVLPETNLCVYVVGASSFPSSIANKYSASENGGCSDTLGSQCVQSVLGAVNGYDFSTQRCPQSPFSTSLNGCGTSLGSGDGLGVFSTCESTLASFLSPS